MRNFVEHQQRARQRTTLLIVLMALAVIAMGCAIYALLLVLARFQGGLASVLLLEPLQPWQPKLLAGSVLGTAGVVAVASTGRTLSLRGGGAQVAEMLGGRLVSGHPRNALEKRLLNVVEEMAIASGAPVPQVFVLAEETGINAFAAGESPGDTVIAVTGGALEKLTRDELQGVIAHEFSHLRNGDTRLNLRLMGVVFGILCIGLFGRMLLRAGSRGFGRSAGRKRGGAGGLLVLIGLGVLLVGLLGEFFSKLIKAAISREREFLADASAVQFTRNPQGIAGALKKIGGYGGGGRLASERAEEASHFFFADISSSLAVTLVPGLFRTHPQLAERIRRIEPGFRGEFPEVGEGIAEPVDAPLAAAFAAPLGKALAQAGRSGAASVVERIGAAPADALQCGRQLLARIPSELRAAAESPFSAVAIAYALLLAERDDVRAAQCAELDALSGAPMRAEAQRLWPLLRQLPRALRLPLCALLSPALHALSERQRAAFTRSLSALVHADGSVSLFEFVLTETLRERLAGGRSAAQRTRVRHKSLNAVSREVALCLSLLAQAAGSARGGAAAARAFGAGAARLSGVSLAALPASDRLLLGLPAALAELRALALPLRAQVVDAAAHCVLEDGEVADDEATLLCALCDALDCPVPPFIAPETGTQPQVYLAV